MAETNQDQAPVPGKRVTAHIQTIKTPETDRLQVETAFTFTFTHPETGRVYDGTFRARRLSIGGLGQVAVQRARLNGGQPAEAVGAQVDYVHYMLAFCQFSLVEFPDWWNPANDDDALLLEQVYGHVRSWHDTFRGSSKG